MSGEIQLASLSFNLNTDVYKKSPDLSKRDWGQPFLGSYLFDREESILLIDVNATVGEIEALYVEPEETSILKRRL